MTLIAFEIAFEPTCEVVYLHRVQKFYIHQSVRSVLIHFCVAYVPYFGRKKMTMTFANSTHANSSSASAHDYRSCAWDDTRPISSWPRFRMMHTWVNLWNFSRWGGMGGVVEGEHGKNLWHISPCSVLIWPFHHQHSRQVLLLLPPPSLPSQQRYCNSTYMRTQQHTIHCV